MIKLDVLMVLLDPGHKGMPNVFKLLSSLMSQNNMATILGRGPIVLMLCLHSTMLMLLKVSPTKGKMATDVRSSLGIASIQGRL
jgi:hypothetical protein